MWTPATPAMRRPFHSTLLPLLIAAAACGDALAPGVPSGAELVSVEALPNTVLSRLNSGYPTRDRLVLRDSTAWQGFWDAATSMLSPRPPAPQFEFSTHTVLVAAMGTRESGGYAIAIESVHRDGDVLYVVVRERSPGQSCAVTMGATAPVTGVLVPRHDGEVRWVERSQTVHC